MSTILLDTSVIFDHLNGRSLPALLRQLRRSRPAWAGNLGGYGEELQAVEELLGVGFLAGPELCSL